jgi:hypothetical protein
VSSPVGAPAAGSPSAQPSPPPNQTTGVAPSQSPSAPAPGLSAPAPVASTPPAPGDKRGFLSDFGDWWKKSSDDFNAKLKEQQSQIDDFNKKSADAMKSALTPSKVVEAHEVCALAGNGAADCASAALNVCKAKGFNAGQPLDVRTAERCNASLWVSGQNPATTACPVETMVLRASCQ